MCLCVCKAVPYGSCKQEVGGGKGDGCSSFPLLSRATESTNQIMIQENGHGQRKAGFLAVICLFSLPLSPLVCLFSSNLCVCVCEGEIKQSNGERGKEGGGRERECVQRGRGQSMCVCVCVCVCSQGFDTAIQALRLPWSRPPYMAIGVKEQREWAVWGSMHTHTHTHRKDVEDLSPQRCREHDPEASKKHPDNTRLP